MRGIFLTALSTFLVVLPLALSAQRPMKVDSALRVNSLVWYLSKNNQDLGPYFVQKHRRKWTAEAETSDVFRVPEHFTRSDRSSFRLVSIEGDTLIVNSGVVREPAGRVRKKTTVIEVVEDGYIQFGRERVWIKVYKNVGFASYHFSQDSVPWSSIMTVFAPEDSESTTGLDEDVSFSLTFTGRKNFKEIKKHFKLMEGWLSDGVTDITIRPVTIRQDGTSPRLLPFLGFEYLIDGVAVAAIDLKLPWMKKKEVYFHHDLDPQTRMVIAAAMMSMVQD